MEATPAAARVRAAPIFEPEFIDGLCRIFEELASFNKLLGVQVLELMPDRATCRFAMRPELVGHFQRKRLHGGVISTVMDTAAGVAVMAALGVRHREESVEQRLTRFARLGTIDLRVDFLAEGRGDWFSATAQVVRLGSRVANTRMEFRSADGRLVSTGAAAYIVA